jgi:hypothetical protein
MRRHHTRQKANQGTATRCGGDLAGAITHLRSGNRLCLARQKAITLPIVFLDGKEEAINSAKARVPAAIFTTSGELAEILDVYARAGWG